MSNQKKILFLKLSRDAQTTSDRERKYAFEALGERKYALADERTAKKNHQISREEDSKTEADICQIFYKYRIGVAHHYRDVSRKMRKMAKGV